MNLFKNGDKANDKGSGIPGYNLMFLKIAINMDKDEFARYQIVSTRTGNEMKEEIES